MLIAIKKSMTFSNRNNNIPQHCIRNITTCKMVFIPLLIMKLDC